MIPGAVAVAHLHPGEVRTSFMMSMFDLLVWDSGHANRILSHPHGLISRACGTGGLVDARNAVAEVVLHESEAEWLLMVDSDMTFEADVLEQLIAAADPITRPVVGGLCFAQKPDRQTDRGTRYLMQPTLYRFVDLPDRVAFAPLYDYVRGELVQVDGTGAACLLVHRSALATVEEKFGRIWFEPITHAKGPTVFSEDLSFCARLNVCGVPLYVHTGIKVGHDKGSMFLDEEAYDAQRAAVHAGILSATIDMRDPVLAPSAAA